MCHGGISVFIRLHIVVVLVVSTNDCCADHHTRARSRDHAAGLRGAGVAVLPRTRGSRPLLHTKVLCLEVNTPTFYSVPIQQYSLLHVSYYLV